MARYNLLLNLLQTYDATRTLRKKKEKRKEKKDFVQIPFFERCTLQNHTLISRLRERGGSSRDRETRYVCNGDR